MLPNPWPTRRLDVADAIECMVAVLPARDPDVLLMSTVDENDFIGPGDSFRLNELKQPIVSPEVMFELPTRLGAARVLFGARSSGPIEDVDPNDRALTQALVGEATRRGLGVAEVVFVEGKTFRLMIESLRDDS